MRLLDQIEEDWFMKRPIRYVIDKSRRQGISTLVEAVLYVLCGKLVGLNALVVSDDQDGSNYLTDITRLYHKKLKEYDKFIMPNFSIDNPKKIVFQGNNSELYIDTARNVSMGRKYTYHLVHLSEVAFYQQNVENMMLGLLQTIADMPYTIVIMESTANGVGNYFHREFKRAEQKLSDYRAIFFSRYEDPDNRRPFNNDEEKAFILDTMDAEEKEDFVKMRKMYDKDEVLERLNWRRRCISNQCGGSLDNFHQEYPANAEESFLVSGRTRFNAKILAKMLKVCRDPIKRGTIFSGRWEDHSKGDIKIWKEFQEGHKYVAGIDTMRGKLVAETTREPDYNDMQVIDIATMEQVAEIHNRDDSAVFGKKVVWLAEQYGNALLGIENNQGQGLIAYCKRVSYWHLYTSIVYDEFKDRRQKAIGWNANQKNKNLLEDDLATFIRDQVGKIWDVHTVGELLTFVVDDDGKAGAQEGCWDDRVMAFGIAVQMVQHAFLEKEKIPDPKDIPYTFAWERERILRAQKEEGYNRWIQ
jgi:hypothetical protein